MLLWSSCSYTLRVNTNAKWSGLINRNCLLNDPFSLISRPTKHEQKPEPGGLQFCLRAGHNHPTILYFNGFFKPTITRTWEEEVLLKDMDFPLVAKICVIPGFNQTALYEVGYVDTWDYFIGRSRLNYSLYDWALGRAHWGLRNSWFCRRDTGTCKTRCMVI